MKTIQFALVQSIFQFAVPTFPSHVLSQGLSPMIHWYVLVSKKLSKILDRALQRAPLNRRLPRSCQLDIPLESLSILRFHISQMELPFDLPSQSITAESRILFSGS